MDDNYRGTPILGHPCSVASAFFLRLHFFGLFISNGPLGDLDRDRPEKTVVLLRCGNGELIGKSIGKSMGIWCVYETAWNIYIYIYTHIII